METLLNRIHIRSYAASDKAKVVNLFRLNTPVFFSHSEEKDLTFYLDHEVEHYFVLDLDQKIIGCGGINLHENNTLGYISWDILHPDFHGYGLGTMLLRHRISMLQNDFPVKRVIVRTSQLVYPFYEKNGFRLIRLEKDYWAKGFDLYHMELEHYALK